VEPVPTSLAGATDLEAALVELADYSLLELEGAVFSIHRLVQDVQGDQLPPAERTAWVRLTLRVLEDYAPCPPDDVRTWNIWTPLRPHAEAILAHADGCGITDATSTVMNNLAIYLHARALYAEAEPLLHRALALDEKSLGPDHPDVARDLNNLAQLLKDTNRLGEAEPLMRRALALAEKSFGPDHPDVAIDLNNLALLLQATNRLGEAEPLLRRAVDIWEKSLGPEHPDVALGLGNLGRLLQDMGRAAEAGPLLARAQAIDALQH